MIRTVSKKVVFILFFIFLWSGLAGAADEIRIRYDRYCSIFQKYSRAIVDKADEKEIARLAGELRKAKEAYNKVANPEGASQLAESNSSGISATGPLDRNFQTGNPLLRSTEEREYDALVGKLYSKDRKTKGQELLKELKAFIQTAKNPYFIQEATTHLAELVFDLTQNPKVTENILQTFLGKVPTAAAKKVVQARIKLFYAEKAILDQRKIFNLHRAETTEKWQKFFQTSWLALPAKLSRLTSYFWANAKRRYQGKILQKLSNDYNEISKETNPPGTLDRFTNSNLIPCNDVTLLVNGRSSFARRFELAKQAKDRIYLQTLLYYNDETGIKLADLLIEKVQAGVEVCVIVDDAFAQGRKSSIIQRLKNGGVKVQLNNPLLRNPFKANFRSHQKMFIVDEEVAIVGGMNVANEYAYGEIEEHGWRDTDVELRGPVVADIGDLFDDNWMRLLTSIRWDTGSAKEKRLAEKEEKPGILPNRDKLIRGPLPIYFQEPPTFENVRVRFLKTFPERSKDDDVLDLFTAYLRTAKEEVILESAYFIPHPRLQEAIAEACRRGVKVKIITNSVESNNHPNAGYAGRACFEPAMKAGAEIYEWRGAQTLHSKVTCFDNFAVTIGAYNLNSRSNSLDSEDIISIEDRRFAEVFKRVLLRDLARCRKITQADIERWRSTFSERFKMLFFKQFKSIF